MPDTTEKMKRVTIKDIAKVSGYSANCVSRALMDAPDISEATKEKIRELAHEMGYIPNVGAASLRSGNSNTIGIICDNIANPFYTIMMNYISRVFAEEKYIFITFYASSAYCTEKEIRQAVSSNVDGILSFLAPDESATRLIKKLRLPLVVIGRRTEEHDCFIIDDVKGGFCATEYLCSRGMRKIYYLGDVPHISCSMDRGRGYRASLESHGLSYCEFYVTPGGDPADMVKRMLDESGVPDGVFCFNDLLAYYLIEELERRGISDVGIVGFDDLHHEMHYCARITSVGYDKSAFGTAAARRLIARIRGEADGVILYSEDVHLEGA